jgi:hypothetical protein
MNAGVNDDSVEVLQEPESEEDESEQKGSKKKVLTFTWWHGITNLSTLLGKEEEEEETKCKKN